MCMKLDPLDFGLVFAFLLFDFLHRIRKEHEFVLECVETNRSPDPYEHAFLHRRECLLVGLLFFFLEEFLATDTIRSVGKIEEQELRVCLELS